MTRRRLWSKTLFGCTSRAEGCLQVSLEHSNGFHINTRLESPEAEIKWVVEDDWHVWIILMSKIEIAIIWPLKCVFEIDWLCSLPILISLKIDISWQNVSFLRAELKPPQLAFKLYYKGTLFQRICLTINFQMFVILHQNSCSCHRRMKFFVSQNRCAPINQTQLIKN